MSLRVEPRLNRIPRPPNWLYSDFIETGRNRGLAEYFWNRVPLNLGEATRCAVKLRNEFGDNGQLEKLKKAMKTQLRRWGILTSLVEENIDRIEQGVIESEGWPIGSDLDVEDWSGGIRPLL